MTATDPKVWTQDEIANTLATSDDEHLKYQRFKELMEEVMAKHQAKDEASGYQMYSYPSFNDRTRRILAKCSTIKEGIERIELEDPDGWIPEFLWQIADRC